MRPTWPEETGRNDWCVYEDGELVAARSRTSLVCVQGR